MEIEEPKACSDADGAFWNLDSETGISPLMSASEVHAFLENCGLSLLTTHNLMVMVSICRLLTAVKLSTP